MALRAQSWQSLEQTRLLQWDGKDDRGESVGSGVYFFRVATPDGVVQRKVAVLR